MTVIAVANQKGGIGKTTTSAALAANLKKRGFRVLAIDMDPQGNLSMSSGSNIELPTVYELLKEDASVEEVVQHLDAYDIIPANIMLSAAEQELSHIGKEQRLKERLEPIMGSYDYVVIDTPPSLGILTINAFTAADEIIIPTTAGIFAATGIKQLNSTISSVKKYCNNNIKIAGILLTKYDPRTNNSKDMKELTLRLSEFMNTRLFDTYIRSSVVVEEAQARNIDIFTYQKNSNAAKDYEAFVDEYLEMKGMENNG